MDVENLKKCENQLAFYKMTSLDLSIFIKRSLCVAIKRHLNDLEQVIVKRYKDNEAKKEEVRKDMEELYKIQIESIEEPFKKLELAIQERMNIPEWVIQTIPQEFSESELNTKLSPEEITKIKQETKRLVKEYNQKKTYVEFLKNELQKLRKLERINSLVPQLLHIANSVLKNETGVNEPMDKLAILERKLNEFASANNLDPPSKSHIEFLVNLYASKNTPAKGD